MIVVQLVTECYHLASTGHQTISKLHLFRLKFCELELALGSPGLLPMSYVVIFSSAGQLCSGHSLLMEATCRVLEVGRVLDHVSLIISISWTVLVQMIITEFQVEKWKCVRPLTPSKQIGTNLHLLYSIHKIKSRGSLYQEEVSGACGHLMEIATVS